MRKQHGNKHKFSLFLAIIVSAVIFTLISVVGKLTIYQGYDLNLWKTPIMAVMFEAVKDGVYPWDLIHKVNEQNSKKSDLDVTMASGVSKEDESEDSGIENSPSGLDSPQSNQGKHNQTELNQSNTKDKTDQGESNAESESSDAVKDEENSEKTDSGRNNSETGDEVSSKDDLKPGKEDSTKEDSKPGKEDSSKNDSNKETQKEEQKEETSTKETETTTKDTSLELVEVELGEVEQDYFDDALFIGDSRTVGLSEYSYLDNATYYSDVGLSVYSVFDKKIAKMGKKSVTLEKALEKKQFKKIYIMLGINELGTGTTKTFVAKYKEMIDRILELQPDAYIMVQAIMNVGKEMSDTDKIFNNKNINDRNEGLETLADDKQIFYINVNEVLTDKKGYIPENYTFDSIHLKAKYYDKWADFLMEHGLVAK